MPDKATLEHAREDRREGKAASTQAGEFVKEEMDHIREGKHGARSTKQAIAIGLSKARRAGVDLPPPKPGTASLETRRRGGTGPHMMPVSNIHRVATLPQCNKLGSSTNRARPTITTTGLAKLVQLVGD